MNLQNFNLERAMGLRGMIYDAESKVISVYGKRIKSKFGIEMKFNSAQEVEVITEWIQKYDNKFEYHIENPYLISSIMNIKPRLAGTFFIRITKATYAYIDVSSHIKKSDNKYDDNTSVSIYMYIFGKKCYAVFNDISKYMKSKIKTDDMIYSIVGNKGDNNLSGWLCTATDMVPRSMDTIFIPEDQKKRIIDHLDKWVKNESIYKGRGLIYKTGILLHGAAGTGKTSLAIATYLHCSLITIDTTTFQYMNISEITDSMNSDNETYVVLIDEIDNIGSRDDENMTESRHDKISKLLSFLDSQQSPTRTVFVATTNYVDRLDKALTRPGRFALIEELKDLTPDLAVDMCKSFDVSSKSLDNIIKSIDGDSINPDKLQSIILSELRNNE